MQFEAQVANEFPGLAPQIFQPRISPQRGGKSSQKSKNARVALNFAAFFPFLRLENLPFHRP
jgi:hypothetical protein